jgi:hypothetical protein
MPREDSPFVYGEYWLDKRRDGKAADVWQIAWYEPGTRQVRYRSTKRKSLDEARSSSARTRRSPLQGAAEARGREGSPLAR